VTASRQSGWARSDLALQIGCVLALALALALCGYFYGQHEARQCAIDYSHDGQCGLEALAGLAFGVFGAIVVVALGGVAIWYPHRGEPAAVIREDEDEDEG
jgi:hypothetical protein